MLYDVIVTRPFDKVFTYASNEQLKIGQVVLVPFGKREEIGIIWSKNTKKPNHKIKNISKIIEGVIFKNTTIEFINWIANYTLAPLGSVLKLFLINKDIVDIKIESKFTSNLYDSKIKLNDEQENARSKIITFISKSKKPIVLEGVTGSGKTEVYFKLIEDYLNKNNQILIMVPEISLTPQLESRFKERFGIDVFIWHSKITNKNRQKIWHYCLNGERVIVIGARSSLFLPFLNLGLVIVDEEHDPSYKQEDNIRYQARDLAIVRSKIEKTNIILASATPSLETINNFKISKYDHVYLSKQFSGTPLPDISLIDLSLNKLEKDRWVSNKIVEEIKIYH